MTAPIQSIHHIKEALPPPPNKITCMPLLDILIQCVQLLYVVVLRTKKNVIPKISILLRMKVGLAIGDRSDDNKASPSRTHEINGGTTAAHKS